MDPDTDSPYYRLGAATQLLRMLLEYGGHEREIAERNARAFVADEDARSRAILGDEVTACVTCGHYLAQTACVCDRVDEA